MNDSPGRKLVRYLFVLLAPISVPVYLAYVAYVNLAGLAFYVVFDMTLTRILGRPAAPARGMLWLLSPLILAAAGPLLVVHLLLWFLHATYAGLIVVGRWQTGLRREAVLVVTGTIWTALFVWSLIMCIDGLSAVRMLGQTIPGSAAFDNAINRHLRLVDLNPDMQRRRVQLRQRLLKPANDEPSATLYAEMLADDELTFDLLPGRLKMELAGLPWFYVAADLSHDGQPHCRVLIGPCLLVLLIMIRWPGVPPWPRLYPVAYVLRIVLTSLMLWYTLNWQPRLLTAPPTSIDFKVLAPFKWLDHTLDSCLPPEWNTLNAALWLVICGIAALIWWTAVRLARVIGAPRYYSAYLAARLLQRKRIAFFSVGAVTLCVAMLLIVISVMGGFVDTIRARATGLLGELVMDPGDLRGFPFYDQFIAEIRQWPEVKAATALIHTYGTLRFERGESFPARIWGIRYPEYCGVNRFCDELFYEKHYPGTTHLAPASQPFYGFDPVTTQPVLPEPYESAFRRWYEQQPEETRQRFARVPGGYFPGPGRYAMTESRDLVPELAGRSFPGMIIGRDLLFRREPSGEYRRTDRYPRGCKCVITLLPLSRTGVPLTESPPAPAFRYVDDSRTGIYEIDSKNVYVDFNVLQEKLAMNEAPRADGSGNVPPRCSQIQIKLHPGTNLIDMKNRVADAWSSFSASAPADADDARMMSSVHVSTWEELQAEYIAAIQKEKVLVVIMFSIISVVAVFLVLCIFYMIVIEKTRDIGIIKSVGGSAEGVAAIFLTYGAAIGIVGSALGTLLGVAFVRRINDIQDWLARLNPEWRVWSPETYSFDQIPNVVRTSDIVLIGIAAVLASILGAVVPALRAARTWPVEALRYE